MKYSNSNDKIRIKMVDHIDKLIQNKSLSRKIEQSIYNYMITLSKEKNIQRKWNNQIFYKLYHSKILSTTTRYGKRYTKQRETNAGA